MKVAVAVAAHDIPNLSVGRSRRETGKNCQTQSQSADSESTRRDLRRTKTLTE
jgi:hypothetical protein